jgi:hydrogenase maturation protease
MDSIGQQSMPAVVIGIGSDHGDDQAGWQVVRMLRDDPRFKHKAVEVGETTCLIDHLAGCEHLVVVDASSSGAPPSTISRLTWPSAVVQLHEANSTHGVGVADALRLAEQLGRLPRRVVLFGVEGVSFEPASDMSPAVYRALPAVVDRVIEELDEETKD